MWAKRCVSYKKQGLLTLRDHMTWAHPWFSGAVHVVHIFIFPCFVLFVFVLCLLYPCCQCVWIVHSWLPIRFSLTFIYKQGQNQYPNTRLHDHTPSRWGTGTAIKSAIDSTSCMCLTSSLSEVMQCYLIFSFICMFCRSLLVLLYMFFWSLCCLFNIRILITSLWYLQPLLSALNF